MRTERTYPIDEVISLLDKAEEMGFSLGKGSELEQLTIEELERLVTVKQ